MEFGYKGGPYEINLRDILFWCELLISPKTGFYFKFKGFMVNFDYFLLTLYECMKLVYYQRMRCEQDKLFIRNAFSSVFECDSDNLHSISEDVGIYWNCEKIYFNDKVLHREAEPLNFQKSVEHLPLLLGTQRETLKNLIECVHMEKPVLLCGSTDTGKTKIIGTLCCLSNQMYNSENIDDSVTGNFEQVDFNRHLEAISYEVECIYIKCIQNAFLYRTSSFQMVIELLDSWSAYSISCSRKYDFVFDELINYLRRIDKLSKVIEVILKYHQFFAEESDIYKLNDIFNMLKLLHSHVKKISSLNTGGSFEWVDSKIVKSLKYGQYISLEHVNLCSPAVLDRLNPVFEPNGSLMLSEKGVTDNKKAEIVKKAKNFRAFLTLDPKNGELSRAMRNRCVEIFLNHKLPNLDDKRILVFHQGVRDINAINCIIDIHDQISKLTDINNFTLSHLMQTAFLTASYKRIGYKMNKAIYASAMDVYVYPANIDLLGYGLSFYQNKLREVVKLESEKLVNLPANIFQQDYLGDTLLYSGSLTQISLIKMQIVPLRIILDNLSNPIRTKTVLCQVFSDFEDICVENICFKDFAKYLVYVAYEISSMNDLRLRYLQLEKYLKVDNKLKKLSKVLYDCIADFDKAFKVVQPSLPWNIKIFPRIRDYNMESIDFFENKALCLSCSLIINMLQHDIPQEAVTKISTISAITYSQAVAKGMLTDKLSNPFLRHFSEFLFYLQDLLKNHIKEAKVNIKSYTQLITAILWYNRVLNISKANVHLNNEINTVLLDKLILHFKWLDKYLLTLLFRTLPNIEILLPEFQNCLHKLTNYTMQSKHSLTLRRKIYTKHLLEFQPFYQEDQIIFYMKIHELDQLLQVIPLYGNIPVEDVIRKLSVQSNESTRKIRAFIHENYYIDYFSKIKEIRLEKKHGKFIPEQLKLKLRELFIVLANDSTKKQSISLDNLELIDFELKNISYLINSPQQMNAKYLEKPHEMELAILVIRDYFLVKFLTTSVENPAIYALSHLNGEYLEKIPYLSSTYMSALNICKLSYHRNYSDFWFILCTYMNHIKTVAEFQELLMYLNGGYKHLLSVTKLISNVAQKLQLESLSSHPECIQIYECKDEIQSKTTYKGSTFINTILNFLFSKDGAFKTVSLCDMNVWKNALNQLCQITWYNSVLITPKYNIRYNFTTSKNNAKRLLLEVGFIEMLCNDNVATNITDHVQYFREFVAKLKKVVSILVVNIKSKPDSIKNQEILYKTSLTNTLISCIELCLITFTPLIDPVEKNRLKKKYISDDIYCLNNFKYALDFIRVSMKYKHLGEEIYKSFTEEVGLLKDRHNKLKRKVAFRPKKCLYGNLVKDIKHCFTTNCSPQILFELINNIESTWKCLTEKSNSECLVKALSSCEEVINKINLWIANSQNFIHHTLDAYSFYYQDFIQPLKCSIDQLHFSFEGLKNVLSQIKNCIIRNKDGSFTNINANNNLHEVLKNLIEFPSSKMINIFNVNPTKDVLQNLCPVFDILSRVTGCETDSFHLLKAKLIELKNRASISHFLNQELFTEFEFSLNIINKVWQREEEERRQKQMENESLYLTRTKCQEENEELQELQEINENFPTAIQEDFGDFIKEDTLEKVMKLHKKNTMKTKKDFTVLQENDYIFIAKVFIDILVKHTQCYYHPKNNNSENTDQVEFVDYFKERLGVFVRLYNNYKSSVNDWLDDECFNSLYFSMCIQMNLLNDNINLSSKKDTEYNFYKDSNIQEIMSCVNVLKSVEQKVDEQLELYAEHATLIDIKKIIERIRLLPSSAPVVRFNIGFQILRRNVALWNEVAHKNNNFKSEEQEIAEYVQKWTRLELQYWRNCLTNVKEKVECNVYKYWFFVYNLIHEYVEEHKIDHSDSNCEAEDLNSKRFKVDSKGIIDVLRKFLESSCYGDFCIRMELLLAFELYLNNLVNYTQDGLSTHIYELISGIRNLLLYFDQFSNEIEEHKNSVKLVIGKKLKELVKIESYNKDLSYVSMRNDVARVHRNLNKILKEYEEQLKGKITPIFQPTNSVAKEYNFSNDNKNYLEYEPKTKSYMIDAKYFVLEPRQTHSETETESYFLTESQSLLRKVQHLFSTSRNLVKSTVTNADYPMHIMALDIWFAQQLERWHHLRNLSIDRTKERSKQRVESKQILQQKRKALADFFKTLSVLGVNYKTGLLELLMHPELEDFSLPPFCIKTISKYLKEKKLQQKLLQLDENLDMYFNKCVFKLKLLQNVMLTPSSELGPSNIERLKGYAVDFFILVQNQRKLLAVTTKNIYNFQAKLQQLREFDGINTRCNPIDESYTDFPKIRDCFDALKIVISRIRYVFEQFKLFLSCAPSKCKIENVIITDGVSLLNSSVDQIALLIDCENILSLSKTAMNDLNNESCELILKDRLDEYMLYYHKLYKLIQDILKKFKNDGEYCLPIAKPIRDLFLYMNDTMKVVSCGTNHMYRENNFDSIHIELENVIHAVLISLQKLYKKYLFKRQLEENEKLQKETETVKHNIWQVKDQHLRKHIYEELKIDWNVMNMEKINEKITNILLTIKLSEPSMEKVKLINQLIGIRPLLEQFTLMAEYYLYQQLGAHKVTVKILSTMLTAFVEIGIKGFCIPQDLMEEENGETKDQKEGGGFGLDDGTGEIDVSEKIESEDQLDDAKRPEDRKKEDNKDDQNICKEDKGIDLSENFDSEMLDIERENEKDDSRESDNGEDLEKEMGETEGGAENLDDQIWGDDMTLEDEEEEREMREEDGIGSNNEKDTHNDFNSKNDTSKDTSNNCSNIDGLDATDEQCNRDLSKQKNKEIDNIQNEEVDHDQMNPYHNELEGPIEPEDFNLEDLNVDEENEDDDNQRSDGNPFDIDTMKENMQNFNDTFDEDNQNEEGDEDQNKEHDVEYSDSSDDYQCELQNDSYCSEDKEQNEEKTDNDSNEKSKSNNEAKVEEDTEKREVETEEYEQSKKKSNNKFNMELVPAIETEVSEDQLETERTSKDIQQDHNLDEQDTGEEKDGIGQAENSNNKGHQGISKTKKTITPDDSKVDTHIKESKKQKQGQTDENRSIEDAEQNKAKRLKTINTLNKNDKRTEDVQTELEEETKSDEYQHVKKPNKSDTLSLDNATDKQSKEIQPRDLEMINNDDNMETDENQIQDLGDEAFEEVENDLNVQEVTSEKLDKSNKNSLNFEQSNEQVDAQNQQEVEGEIIKTMTVPRSEDTTAHCKKELLLDNSGQHEEISTAKTLELRKIYQGQTASQQPILTQNIDYLTWQDISCRMAQNARDLCEQLRLILEPTKCTRFKGDYRTGRRINMKKIIPYIASQFRKDKIWLRRTKPAKRDYKITIAIDDSKSMHHNNSKILTLEAISLVSQALTLLECGHLSIISFGEQPQVLLSHNGTFDGPKLVSSLQFSQNKTKVAELLDFVRIANAEGNLESDNGIFENLLLLLSDGRNIFSEGRSKVKNAIKLARLQRIFLVYIIIDNPQNKNSIIDIQTMEMMPNNRIDIKSYLEDFPFPYYVIVRDLNQLPLVLSESMRQWFELVNSEQ